MFSQRRVSKAGAAGGKQWLKRHESVRLSEEVKDNPWTAAGKRTLGIDTERGLDMLNVCWGTETRKANQLHGGIVSPDLVLDVSQCLSCHPWAPHIRSMTQGSTYFHFGRARALVGLEHMLALGFPRVNPAGEAMSPPCVGVVAAALLMSLPTDAWEHPR